LYYSRHVRALSQRMSGISKQTGLLFAWENRVCRLATSDFEIGQVSEIPYSLFWVSCYAIPDKLRHSAKALPSRTNIDDINKQSRQRFRYIMGRCYRRMGENFMSRTLINCTLHLCCRYVIRAIKPRMTTGHVARLGTTRNKDRM